MGLIKQISSLFDPQHTGKRILLSMAIGVMTGLAAIAFQFLTQLIQAGSLAYWCGYSPLEPVGEHPLVPRFEREFRPWLLMVLPMLGGLVSGWLVFKFAPEAEGHGTDAAIDAFHNKRGEIRARIPFVKALSSAITIGTGGSAGREGPIAQIGAGIGSSLASRLGLSVRDRRILLATGMGAGIGAIFRAPLAGALFAGEILYRDSDFEADVIVPSAVASTIAYSVYCLTLPYELRFAPLFGEQLAYAPNSFFELIPFGLLAIVLTLGGGLYVSALYGTQAAFKRLALPPHVKPAIGGLLAGLIGILLYFAVQRNSQALSVLGTGYGILQSAMSPGGSVALGILLAVAAVKIVTTSLTISSGGSGGVFGPSMVIGGCLGGVMGGVFHQWWPAFVTEPRIYVIVGMAGFFAGAARAPISTIIMVSEMTGSYKLLLPTLWVATLSFVFSSKWTLYRKQVPTRIDSPAHRGDFIVDVLEGIRVADVYQPGRQVHLVHEGATLDEIVHMLARTTQRYFPVVNDDQQLVGIFSADDVRSYLFDDTIWEIANARDVMSSPVVAVTPEDDLNTVLRRLTALNVDELPVVPPDDSTRLIGFLRRKETIAAYNKRLLELKDLYAS